jgi:ribose 1,5-bisphosphokinase PhnN
MPVNILAFAGGIGAGKDFLVKEIEMNPYFKKIKFVHLSFGKKLKEDFSKINKNINISSFERRLGIRELALINGPETYVNYLQEKIDEIFYSGEDIVILISDVRTSEQMRMLKKYNTIFVYVQSDIMSKRKIENETDGDREKVKILREHYTEKNILNNIILLGCNFNIYNNVEGKSIEELENIVLNFF